MRVELWVIAAALVAPVVHASPVKVLVENGKDETDAGCVGAAAGTCLATGRVDGAGGTWVDAAQRTEAVGLVAPGVKDLPLLPDDGLVLRGSDLVVPNPAIPMLRAALGEDGAKNASAAGLTYVLVEVDERRLRFGWHGPTYDDTAFEHREAEWYWSQGERGVHYDRVILPDVGETETDHRTRDTLAAPCAIGTEAASGCHATAGAAADALAGWTPNATVGLTWKAVGVAPHEAAFEDGGQEGGARETASLPMRERTPPAEAPRVPRPSPSAPPAGPREAPPDAPAAAASPRAAPSASAPAPLAIAGDASAPTPPGALAGAAAAAASFALALVAKLLYARISSARDALQHQHRQAMLDMLARQGPLTLTELATALGVDRTTVLHHARVLARSGTMLVERRDRRAYLLLPGQALPETGGAGGGKAAQEVLRAIAAAGGAVTRSRLQELVAHVPARARNAAIRDLAATGAIVRGFAGNEETVGLPAATA